MTSGRTETSLTAECQVTNAKNCSCVCTSKFPVNGNFLRRLPPVPLHQIWTMAPIPLDSCFGSIPAHLPSLYPCVPECLRAAFHHVYEKDPPKSPHTAIPGDSRLCCVVVPVPPKVFGPGPRRGTWRCRWRQQTTGTKRQVSMLILGSTRPTHYCTVRNQQTTTITCD